MKARNPATTAKPTVGSDDRLLRIARVLLGGVVAGAAPLVVLGGTAFVRGCGLLLLANAMASGFLLLRPDRAPAPGLVAWLGSTSILGLAIGWALVATTPTPIPLPTPGPDGRVDRRAAIESLRRAGIDIEATFGLTAEDVRHLLESESE